MNKTLFVVFEGIDGSGKTTLINAFRKNLEKFPKINEKFQAIEFIKEPGFSDKKFEDQIKWWIFSRKSNLNPQTKALLFFAIRSEQIEKTIIPLVEKGNFLIISDRYYLSTLVYQSGILNLDEAWINKTNELVTKKTIPDLTFYLSISKEEYIKRINDKKLKKTGNTFDEIFNNYESLIENYEKYLESYKEKFGKVVKLDGEENINLLLEKISDEIVKKINE